jgi:spermidine synthase
MEKKLVGVVIFMVGAITMIFEIVGSRLLGPYLGTSVYVWTSLIGIVFASLSLGYWLGGLISVRKPSFILLFIMLGLSAVFVLVATVGNTYILDRVVKYIPGLRLRATIASALLFAPASIFFGMVLPFGVKLMMSQLSTSGRLVGSLYALSTLGSIMGTFAAGFILLPAMGHVNILFSLVLILLVLSLIILIIARRLLLSSLPLTIILLVVLLWNRQSNRQRDYIDVDTQYNRVIIFQTTDPQTNKPIRMLRINDESSSAMFTDQDNDLVFEVLKYYRLVDHFVPGFTHSLMIGGSGYAFPKDYLVRHPEAYIDVVEIDPGLTKLAKKYFNLPDDPRLKIVHDDGRIFLNRTKNRYDAVFMDAYKSMITIPFQLTTREAVQRIYEVLTDEGAVFANIISTLNPDNNRFLQAQTLTYMSVFPQVLLFAVQYPNPTEAEKNLYQNIMLVGLKSEKSYGSTSDDPEINSFLSHFIELELSDQAFILTDEYAPVEYFASKGLK